MQQLSSIEIERIKSLFSKADSLIISAGAGMGVDSGLPDFRGNQGMWRAYPELGK
ncbi:MAG: NAD-dependent deacetylase, partial [Acinetobacter tjernbergiae]